MTISPGAGLAMNPCRWPLTVRLLLGVALGVATGLTLRAWASDELRLQVGGNLELVGKLVVRLLVMLATPLVFCAIIDAFATTHVSGRQGLKLALVCLVNVSCAFAIGLAIMNFARPGEAWQSELRPMIEDMKARAPGSARPRDATTQALLKRQLITEAELRQVEDASQSLSPLAFVERNVPVAFLKPFLENTVLQVVFLAVMVGLALRRVQGSSEEGAAQSAGTVRQFFSGAYRMLMHMLHWIIQLVPLAVFGMLAQVVAKFGLEVFATLWVFLAAILAGLLLHALGYYSLAIWAWGRRPPWLLWQHGHEAILTSLFTNSSLATVPITLRCLTEKMGVSTGSARLSACVGTNFNNDGITLYEAMAAIFLAQALGRQLAFSQQLGILLAALMAAVSITGIPEAGIIVLPLVLSAAGMEANDVAACLVLLLPLDVIIARVRSAVNVMGDMTVAIMLDRDSRPPS